MVPNLVTFFRLLPLLELQVWYSLFWIFWNPFNTKDWSRKSLKVLASDWTNSLQTFTSRRKKKVVLMCNFQYLRQNWIWTWSKLFYRNTASTTRTLLLNMMPLLMNLLMSLRETAVIFHASIFWTRLTRYSTNCHDYVLTLACFIKYIF